MAMMPRGRSARAISAPVVLSAAVSPKAPRVSSIRLRSSGAWSRAALATAATAASTLRAIDRHGDHGESEPVRLPRRLELQHRLAVPDRQAAEQQCGDRDTDQPPDDVGNAAARGSARQRQQTGGHGGCGQGHHRRHAQVCRGTLGGVGGHGQSKGGRHRDGGRLPASRHLDPEVLTAGDGQEEGHQEPPPRLCGAVRDVRDHDDQARQRQHQPEEAEQPARRRSATATSPRGSIAVVMTGPAPHRAAARRPWHRTGSGSSWSYPRRHRRPH